MKQTVRLLSLVMAVLYCSSAFAAVDPYDALEVTPAEGFVTSLHNFTITFADLPVTVNESAIPTLQKGGGATYEGSMRADADGKTVLVDFDVTCTASGEYFLNLPEGSLTVNGQRLLPITLRFIIEGTMDSFYEQITIDPAQGEVESLQNFIISLPEYIGEIDYGSMATLTNTTTNNSYQAEMYGVGFNVLVYFADEVTEPGQYVLTIPAGAIIIYTLDDDIHELNFNYTIAGGTGFTKCGGNYAGSIAGQVKAEKLGYSQVLWLDGNERKYVEEVGTMNIMFKIDGEIWTAPTVGTVLPGVTRDSMIHLLRDWGYKVREERLAIDDLMKAGHDGKLEEVFGTGTAAVISPVGELRFKDDVVVINGGKTGELTQKLYDTLTGIQWGRLEDKYGWTRVIN